MDTAKDARVLVLEDALRRLNEIVLNRKLKMHVDYSSLQSILAEVGGLLYEIKYSYVDSKTLAQSDATIKMVERMEKFEQLFRESMSSGYAPKSKSEELALAELEYSLRIVNGFQRRLQKYEEEPARAVDLLGVEISKTQPLSDSENLNVCRCTDASRIWTIITNLDGASVGMKLPCAVLPPVEMMGTVSEAMFLGMTPLDDGVPLGELKEVPPSALNQARAQVKEITKRVI